MTAKLKLVLAVLACLAFLCPVPGDQPGAEKPIPEARPKTTLAWTLEEAREQLKFHPRDPYLQYVVMQLARREKREEEIAGELEKIVFGEKGSPKVDLFSLLSGTQAMQEGLQLQVMRGQEPGLPALAGGVMPIPAIIPGAGGVIPAGGVPQPVPWINGNGDVDDPSKVLLRALLVGVDLGTSSTAAGTPPWGTLLSQLNDWEEGQQIASAVALKRHAREELAAVDKKRQTKVKLASIEGPKLTSHEWDKLLGGKQPAVSFLSRCVPHDFYLVEFRSLARMIDFFETAEQWMTYLSHQGSRDARDADLRKRLLRQLALQVTALGRPLYDKVVKDVAVTGSDLFLGEGSDVTVIFRLEQPEVFRKQADLFLEAAEKATPDAKRTSGELLGVRYVHVTTPDRSVCVFAADPAPNLHVRSNSRAALQRVLEAVQAKKGVQRLGDSAEYKVIRSRLAEGAAEEDGFIYLSEAFLRHVLGPRLKLAERRRLLSYNHLRLIGHAAQLYRTEHGKAADSLAALVKADCCPGEFNKDQLVCPFGGTYSLTADGAGVCSHCGRAEFLTPCCEVRMDKVSTLEQEDYKTFAEAWSATIPECTPIALRVQTTPKRCRVEAFLMAPASLKAMADMVRCPPEPLDALPVPKRNLFSAAARLPKDFLIEQARALFADSKVPNLEDMAAMHAGAWLIAPAQGSFPGNFPWNAFVPSEETAPLFDAAKAAQVKTMDALTQRQIVHFVSKGLGNQVGIHVYDTPITFDIGLENLVGDLKNTLGGNGFAGLDEGAAVGMYVALLGGFIAPGYVAVPVQDAKVVDDYLVKLDRVLGHYARQRGVFGNVPVEPDYYKLTTRGGMTVRAAGVRVGPLRVRLFWARIGGGLYLANQASVLDDIRAADLARGKDADKGPTAHAMIRVRPRNWDQALPGFRLAWAENNREACLNNLGPLASAARGCTAATEKLSWDDRSRKAHDHAEKLYGVRFVCPEGGHYIVSKDGKSVTCSVHGSTQQPRQNEEPARTSALDRLMGEFADLTLSCTLVEDGVRVTVNVERR